LLGVIPHFVFHSRLIRSITYAIGWTRLQNDPRFGLLDNHGSKQ